MKYRGNLDRSLILSELETKLFWCELEQSDDAAKASGKKNKIIAFPEFQWRGFERNEAAHGIIWWRDLSHAKNMRLLHNPRLTKDLNELKLE